MPGIELDAVEIDNFQGAYDAPFTCSIWATAASAVSPASAIRRSTTPASRGYRQALDQAGIAFDPELLYEGDYSAGSGLAHGRTLLGSLEPPTAAFAFNDLMAMGVMQAAHERGCASRPIWPSSASTGCR